LECEAVRFGCQNGVGGDHVRMAGLEWLGRDL
jgi:hypothetical protein